MAARPAYRPLRLHHVETERDGHKLMFLTVAWGLLADIDLGSERFRWAGMVRLHIEAFIRIARLPQMACYRGRISYKPVQDLALLRNTRIKAEDIERRLGRDHFNEFKVEPLEQGAAVGAAEPLCSVAEAFDGNHLEGHKVCPRRLSLACSTCAFSSPAWPSRCPPTGRWWRASSRWSASPPSRTSAATCPTARRRSWAPNSCT